MREGGGSHASAKADTSVLFRALFMHMAEGVALHEITVDGADFTVALNGQVVNRFHFTGDPLSPRRARPSTPQEPRFIGLQTHTGRLLFRRIQWRAL